MIAKSALAVLICLLSSGLWAADNITVSGTAGPNQESLHLVQVDFGASPGQSATITFDVSGDSAMNGLEAFMADLDSVAALGTAYIDQGGDPGTGTIMLSVTTPTLIGVHAFVLSLKSATGMGTVNYTGTLAIATLDPGSMSESAAQTREEGAAPLEAVFDRAVIGRGDSDSGTPFTQEFLVDFGSSSLAVTFFLQVDGSDPGDVDLFEIDATGQADPIGGVSGGGMGSWSAVPNLTTASRSGMVRLRMVMSSAGPMQASWSAIFPGTVGVLSHTPVDFVGALTPSQDRYYRFTVDFGPVPTELTFMLMDATVTGSLGAILVDLDELVQNGITNAIAFQFPFTTVTGSGVREFLMIFEEDSDTASATYSVEFGLAVPASAVAITETQLGTADGTVGLIFNRAAQLSRSFAAGDTDMRDVIFNFPASGTADYWFQSDSDVTGTVTLHEVDSAGNESLLATLTLDGANPDEANQSLGPRTGPVRLRIKINASGAGNVDWVVLLDSTVTVSLPGAGGSDDGDKKDDGCVAGPVCNGAALALAVLPAFAMLRRRRC